MVQIRTLVLQSLKDLEDSEGSFYTGMSNLKKVGEQFAKLPPVKLEYDGGHTLTYSMETINDEGDLDTIKESSIRVLPEFAKWIMSIYEMDLVD